MPGACHLSDHLGHRPDDSQDAPFGRNARQVLLLDRAQRFCGCGVAGKNDQRASLAKQPLHGFERIGIDGLKRPASIGSARIVAEIKIVISGERPLDLLQDGQPAES